MCLHGMCLSFTIGMYNTLYRSTLKLWITCLATMVYVGYYLFSLYGKPYSVGEVLWSLGCGMVRYIDIAPLGFEDVSE